MRRSHRQAAHDGAVYRASLLELVSLEIFRQQNMLNLAAVQQSMTIGALSLALNLALTGVFIMLVIRLLGRGTKT